MYTNTTWSSSVVGTSVGDQLNENANSLLEKGRNNVVFPRNKTGCSTFCFGHTCHREERKSNDIYAFKQPFCFTF